MLYGLLHWGAGQSIKIIIPVYCFGLFILCMFLHGKLYNLKFKAPFLTSFYLQISLGGAVGGILTGIIAPNVLSGYFELPIILFIVSLIFIFTFYKTFKYLTFLIGFLMFFFSSYSTYKYIKDYKNGSLINVRNFYGTLRVKEYEIDDGERYRTLVHGAINHGSQFLDEKKRMELITYYTKTSGIGRAIKIMQNNEKIKIGVVGLGTGTLSGYLRKDDKIVFFEINPKVEELAKRYFYYLMLSKGNVNVVIGDGRLSIEKHKDLFDIIAIDAFSGDSIPTHLLTKEALKIYQKKLKEQGIIAFHISNKHLDLVPVLGRLCNELNLHCLLIDDTPQDEDESLHFGSDWVLITKKSSNALTNKEILKDAIELPIRTDIKTWTDDYNNLFKILKK